MFFHLHFISFHFILSTVHDSLHSTITQQFLFLCLVLCLFKAMFLRNFIWQSFPFSSFPYFILMSFSVLYLSFVFRFCCFFAFARHQKKSNSEKRKPQNESRVSAFKVLLFSFLFLFLHFYSGYTACEMAWEKHINFLTLVHSH